MHTSFPGLTIPEVIEIALAAVMVTTGLVFLIHRIRGTQLRKRFGEKEYERAVAERAGRMRAEAQREVQCAKTLHLRTLSPGECHRFERAWDTVEAHFARRPAGAIAEADQLLNDVMARRGYPVADFERQAAKIPDHPVVTRHYPLAHAIAVRYRNGQTTTMDDLRRAMIHYRTLFEDLVGGQISAFAAQFDYIPRPTYRA